MKPVPPSISRSSAAKLLRTFAQTALATGISAPLAAQFIWDGGAGTANWGDAVNWSTDVAPPATNGVIQFAGAVQTTVDLQVNRSVASVTFNAGADPFTLQNNTLTLTGTGTILANNSTSLQTVASNLQLTAARTFSATSGNLLYTGGIALSNSGTSRILTFSGANNHTVTGIIANGGTSTAGGVTKTGTGTLVLTGANTYGGQTLVSAGTLRATQAAALGTGTLQVATATLSLAGDSDLTFGRNTSLGGTATIQVDRLTSGSAVTHTLGTLTTGTRTLNLTAGPNIASGTAGLTFGQTNVTGTFTANPAANTLLTLGPLNATAARTINKNGAGTLLLNGPSVDWRTGSALVINNGTTRLGASNVFGATGLTNVTVRSNVAASTATLDLNGFNQSILALTFGGTGSTATSFQQVSTGSGTLTLGGNVTYAATGNNLGALFSGNLNLGSATRTFNIADSTATTSDLSVTALISGSAGVGLIKTGTGSLFLSGSNTYSGSTAISAGTVSINSLANVGAASALGAPTTAALGTIGIGATTTSAALVYTGTGHTSDRVVNLAGTTGGATLSASGSGALVLTSALTATGAGSKTLTLDGTSTAANTLSGAIVNNSGTNRTSLRKTGTGLWVVSGTNTYTGTTTINAGTLRLGSSSSLANSALTVNSTTAGNTALLDLDGFNATVTALTFGGTGSTATSAHSVTTGTGTLTLGGNVTYSNIGNNLGAVFTGNLNLGAATRTFNIADSTATSSDLAVSAVISGAPGVGLTKTGTGTLVLSGANTYSGQTLVSAGTLRATQAAALGTGTLQVATATLSLAGDSDLTFGRNTSLGGTATIQVDRLTSGAAVTHTLGTLTTGSQTLNLTAGPNIASDTAGLTFGQTNVTGTFTANPAANTLLTLGPLNATAARTINKNGAGTLLLNGPSVDWRTGSALVINNGTTRLGASNVFGATGLTNVTVRSNVAASTATLDLDGFNQSILALTFGGTGSTATSFQQVSTGSGTLTLGGNVTYAATGNNLGALFSGNLNLGSATRTFNIADSTATTSDLSVTALISGSAGVGLIKTGTGSLVLSGANTYSGPTTVSAGTLTAGAADTFSVASAHSVSLGATLALDGFDQTIGSLTGAGSVTLGGATLDTGTSNASTTFSGVIGGAGDLAKSGTGTFTLSGANTFLGATSVSTGTLQVTHASALGSSASGTTVASGATLALTGGLNLGTESLTLGGTGQSSTGALRNLSGDNLLGGSVTLTAATTIATDANSLTLAGAFDNAGFAVTLTGAGNTTLGGSLSGAGALVKTGSGTLTLGGTNTYSGATTVSTGTLRVTSDTALGSTAAGTTIASGATLALENNITLAAEPLSLSGTGVGGLGALQNISGDNSFTGSITLAAPTLIRSLAGSLTLSGSIDQAGHALLLGGDDLIALDLVLSPGASITKVDPGTLRFDQAQIDVGTVTLGGGILDLGGLTHSFDTLNVTADSVLEFSGTSVLNLTDLSVASGVTLTITGWTDLVDFFSATNDPGATILGRVIFTPFSAVDTRWQTYDQQITPVPEPSSYGALSLGLLVGTRALRRRRK